MEANKELYQVYTTTSDNGTEEFHFNLLTAVEEPVLYVELFQVLRNAVETDTVHIYLNTPGGRVDTMIQIVNCMKNTKATVVTHLEGICHSAGTFIFLSGDEFVVNPNALLLFHNYSNGYFGKGNEIVQEVIETDKWIKQIADDIYFPFLSREEIDNISSGSDDWMHSKEVEKRLDKLIEYREDIARQQITKGRLAMKEQIDALVAQDSEEREQIELLKSEQAKEDRRVAFERAKERLLEAQKQFERLKE